MEPQRGLSSSWTLLYVTQLLHRRPKPDALALIGGGCQFRCSAPSISV